MLEVIIIGLKITVQVRLLQLTIFSQMQYFVWKQCFSVTSTATEILRFVGLGYIVRK